LTAATRIQATLAADEHADALAAFYRAVWDPKATAESVLRARHEAAAGNAISPGEPPPVALVFDSGRIVGYCGSIPHRLWDGTSEHPAYWVKGLMVLPEYRGGPIGFLVLRELTARLPLSTALAVALPARRLLSAAGYTDFGPVSNYVRPLRPATLLRSVDFSSVGGEGVPRWTRRGLHFARRTSLAGITGAVAGASLRFLAAAVRARASHFATAATSAPPGREELDNLWRHTRPGLAASAVRDGVYLTSRFGSTDAPQSARPYMFVSAHHGQQLAGAAVIRRPRVSGDPRLHGARVATISEIVFPPDRAEVGLALLGAAERVARAADSDAILCTSSHIGLTRLLRRQAYFRLAGNVHFFLRDTVHPERWPQDVASWWLARGDGEADEVF
jgi:GNAT superfamily N-acetyltransferase